MHEDRDGRLYELVVQLGAGPGEEARLLRGENRDGASQGQVRMGKIQS